MQISIFLILFIISFVLFLNYRKVSFKFGIIDKPNALSVHSEITPTAAGIIFLIIFSIGLVLLNFSLKPNINFFDLQKNFLFFLFALYFLCLMSFYDDLRDLNPIIRLIFQVTTIFFCTSLFDLSFLNISIKLLIIIVIYYWVYIINIINFTDGVDGFLATNSLNFFLLNFFISYYFKDYNFIYYVSFLVIPILIAYLIFNKPKAKIFMGDSGSIFLGFLIGFVSIDRFIAGYYYIMISLLAYTFLDCTMTLIKKTLNKNYPWARLFDYYFLKPLKNGGSHKKIFVANCAYNVIIAIIVFLQIIYSLKELYLLSLICCLTLIFYFNSFSKKNLNFN
jgi:UDP-N-acetylmuramyl pentapeptide phosphotransferase/UDP-N-acetylglucosamine-1-phosphate transferase